MEQHNHQWGTYLRNLRLARGWSQSELGERVGLGQKRIAAIEGRPCSVSLGQILVLVDALGGALALEGAFSAAGARGTLVQGRGRPRSRTPELERPAKPTGLASHEAEAEAGLGAWNVTWD